MKILVYGAGVIGCNLAKIFYKSVKDVTILSALMSTIWTINEFETVWLLTGGGPNGTTEVMNVYSYKTAMRSMMLGRGIAVAVLAMPILMILISILTRRMLPEGE